MNKIIIFLLLLQKLVFGCAACQLMTPTAHLSITIDIDKTRAQKIHIQWTFSDVFSKDIIVQYDKDHSKELDSNELKTVQKAMLDYLIPKKMLTLIQYADNDEDALPVDAQYTNFDSKMRNGILIFSYDAVINIEILDKSMLDMIFQDDSGYFNFSVTDLHVKGSMLPYDQNLYLFIASISFGNAISPTKIVKPESGVTPALPQLLPDEAEKSEPKLSLQSSLLQESMEKVKALFESIKDEKNPLSYLLLLLFAYLYGVIHALGPGHGKTLVSSYFLSNDRSYAKAFYISVAIGFVHTFSAFLLTLVIYFAVDTFLAQFLDDTVFFTTKISAFVIIFIALYLLYKKYRAYQTQRRIRQTPTYSFSATPHVGTCSCASCKVDARSTDAALIISAGIIPCPGTTTIFIFAISLGLYYAGFLSALVMSMGMSTIIFFSALLSVAVRKKTLELNGNIKQYLEYASLIVILLLGMVLLIA